MNTATTVSAPALTPAPVKPLVLLWVDEANGDEVWGLPHITLAA